MKFQSLIAVSILALGTSASAAMGDAEIAHVVKTANDGEIAAAQVAQTKAEMPTVKTFAADMLKMHKQNNKESADIAKADKLKLADNDLSKKMKKDAETEINQLKSAKKGAEFDSAYITSQVEMHQMTLDTLEKELIPNAKDAELKAHLEKTRPVVLEHLNQAKAIQTSLVKPMGTETK